MTVRQYTPDDARMIHRWRKEHWEAEIGLAELPPLGVIVEDEKGPMAALFCYEPAGIGCAFLELPVSRLGLSMAEASAAFKFAVTSLMALAGKGWNPPGEYRAFRVTAPPPIARILMRAGWARESNEELIPLIFVREREPSASGE